jgi:hypothetical protein
MKKFFLLGLFFIFLIFPGNVNAHMVGQPPFFKINGEYSDLYPVPTSSITNFNLPQDIAKQNHLVGENLNMEMDVNQLPILPEVIDNTRFDWDFGDGIKANGLKNSHSYNKPGSYVLTIMAAYRTDEPQLIQSTLINVLPDRNYQMPQAKIVANNQSSKDPLIDIIKADFKETVQFDSSSSTAKDGVSEYLWDFGDGQTSNEPNPTHIYDQEAFQVFPVLRVKDQNGFIHDTYIQLENSNEASSKVNFFTSTSNNVWPFIGIVIVVVVGVIGLLVVRKQIKK